MLTIIVRRLLIVAAVTVTIDHVVLRRAVALAGHLRGAIRQQLDIASKHQRNRLVHTAVALWQLGFGLLSDRCHCLTPGLVSAVVPVVRKGVAFPVVRCYDRHCSIPLAEGLTSGRVTRAWRLWSHA